MKTKEKIKGFITIPLSEKTYRFFDKIAFAKTRVPKGTYTDTHFHRFFSAYLVENMDSISTDKGAVKMPERALVIVLPFINHTWSNVKGYSENCYVSDLSPAHGKHLTYN